MSSTSSNSIDMSNYYSSKTPSELLSGDLSISGLTGNGTDFNATIEQLRKIEMIPTQRMLRWKKEWQARQEGFGLVREALVNLRDVCAKMSNVDNFLVKTASSSQPNFATATASSSAIANSYKLEINREASVNIWSLNSEFAAGSTKVTASGTKGTFSYEYKGSIRTLSVPPDTSLEQLKNMINNDTNNPGVRASLIKSANGVTFQIKGMDTGANNSLSILSTDNLTGGFAGQTYNPHQLVYKTNITNRAGGTTYANTSSSEQVFTYSYNGVTRNVDIPAHATLDAFVQAINDDRAAYRAQIAAAQNPPLADPADQTAIDALDKLKNLTVAIDDTDPSGKMNVVFTAGTGDGNQPIVVPKGGAFTELGTPTTTTAPPSSGGWHIKPAENAQIRVDGWPSGTWLEVESNTVRDVVDGVTFNLIGAGTTVVNVSTDNEAVTKNVVDFIDAVNNMRAVINELTKFDANKNTVDYNYAETQFEMQKGSILTGNYGIQMISSRLKQATAGMPPGFLPQFMSGDLALGDVYTSLSQLGIKTKATGEGGEGYGLLELNTDPNLPLLEDILKKNPEAVADFFSALNKGVSDSSDFSFVSSMQTISRPGAYDVRYELDANGKVIPGTAFINGKEAKYYEDTGQLGMLREPPYSSGTVSLPTSATDPNAAFAATAGKFYYTYNGQQYYANVAAGASLNDVASAINGAADNPGVTASVALDNATGEYSLALGGAKAVNFPQIATGASWDFTLEPGVTADIANKVVSSNAATATTTGDTDFTATVTVNQEAVAASAKVQTDMTSQYDPLATAGGRFYYTFNGANYSVDVSAGDPTATPPVPADSLAMIAQKINYHTGNPGVRASVEKDTSTGTWGLVVKSATMGADKSVGNLNWTFNTNAATSLPPPTSGQDANYTITYGSGKTFTKTDGKSNTVTIPDLPGVTFSLKDAGTTTITGNKHNGADGIYIQVDNRTPGAYSGTVRIKQGKINEILEMLNGSANKPEEGMLGSKGTLQVLVNNYKGIMNGIDDKIERETERLVKWERTIKLRFARLQETLKQYESLQATIESQIKQLKKE